MEYEWGRPASAGAWLSTRPAWVLSALVVAGASRVNLYPHYFIVLSLF